MSVLFSDLLTTKSNANVGIKDRLSRLAAFEDELPEAEAAEAIQYLVALGSGLPFWSH
jgi:hypothetical protein